jgi:hypothetical protein
MVEESISSGTPIFLPVNFTCLVNLKWYAKSTDIFNVLYRFVRNTRYKDSPCSSNTFATYYARYLVDIKIQAVAYNW